MASIATSSAQDPLLASSQEGGLTRWYSKWVPASPKVRLALIVTAISLAVIVELSIIFTVGSSTAPTTKSFRGPVVINTWFAAATAVAYNMTSLGYSALDAAEAGCAFCEATQCDTTVGWGNHPDSTGETTLDAIIIDGTNMNIGGVAYLRTVKNAISAARKVLHYSRHTILAGQGASNFSTMMGIPQADLHSNASIDDFDAWLAASCQPNFFANVYNGSTSCPPYTAIPTPEPSVMPAQHAAVTSNAKTAPKPASEYVSQYNHDTIGMCVLDAAGNIAAGASSNGANHKVAGRVGDVPIVGAAVYADNSAGCAAGTGDGDITMRFLPAYQAVEFMRQGWGPQAACEGAVRRIMKFYGTAFQIGLVCMDTFGSIGSASQNWTFTYAVASADTDGAAISVQVTPLPLLP
jgi:N4-(beta-N-acetylglucosaminyl)-L-asparaginase